MGADFLFASVPSCNVTPAREAQIKEFFSSIPDDELFGLCVEWGWPPESNDDLESVEQKAAASRKYLFEIVCESQELLYSREVSTFRVDEMDYVLLLTGGMSWGDSPTTAFSLFQPIETCPGLWGLLKQFAKEDYADVTGQNAAGD